MRIRYYCTDMKLSTGVKLFKLILLITFSFCALVSVNAQDKLGNLKEWVGKYPTYNDTKPHREFLKLPEVRQPLLNLLSKKDHRFLTVECGKEVPIEMIGD